MENYYKVLGLPDYCNDQDQIKKAYRTQVKYYHPDSKNVSPEIAEEQTRKINAAYDVLSDANKKAQYDNQLRYGTSNPYQSYTNQSGTYSQVNPEDFFRQSGFYGFGFPFGFRTYSFNGSGKRRMSPLLRIIITYIIFSFLFRMCSYSRYYYYYDDPYDEYEERYRQEYSGEKGEVKLSEEYYAKIC